LHLLELFLVIAVLVGQFSLYVHVLVLYKCSYSVYSCSLFHFVCML